MTNSPNPGNEPEPTSRNEPTQGRRQRRRLAIVLSLILLTGMGGGLGWVWFFVYKQLAPQVQQTVSKILNRPVKLGKVESFYLNGLRFGSTELPATPQDPDKVSIQAVDVSFNLLPVLLNRTLPLDVTLVKPKVYVEQDKQGQWVNTKLQTLPKGPIDIKLQVLRLRDADVVLVPRGAAGNQRKPVAISLSSGRSNFINDNKLIQFALDGQLVSGGNFQIQGESLPSVGESNIALSGSGLAAPEIGRLIQLPLFLRAGQLNGNLEVKILPQQPLQFLGTATLQDVTARLRALPRPFAKTNGQLRFKGTKVWLENITTIFGEIPAQANGVLDTQSDIQLSAQTQPVELKQVLDTFKIQKSPVAASAQVQAELQVTGPLSQPIVSGKFATTKPAQVDKVNFSAIAANFRVVGSQVSVNNLRATPTFGGLVTGKGEVQLGPKGNTVFDFQASDVPGDAIAKNYNLKLPVPLGPVVGTAQISAPLDKPQNFRITGGGNVKVAGGTLTANNVQIAGGRIKAQVRADEVQADRLAQVPPQLKGPVSGNFNVEASLASSSTDKIQASGSGSLNVAGGTLTATNVQVANGGITAQLRADGVQVERLAQVPPQLKGPLSGNFNVSASLSALTPDKIRGNGSGSLNVAGGTVTATNLQLAEGRFSTQLRAQGVEVERLAQVPPQFRGPLSGNFNVSGSLTDFSLDKIQGSGSGSLNVAGGTVTATNLQLANGGFSTQLRADGVQVERLAQVPPQLKGPLSGNFNVSGSLTNLTPETIRGNGSGTLNVAGGTVTATNLQLAEGRFSTQLRANSVQVERLAQVPPQIKGPLSGNFNVSGSLAALSPDKITGSGSGTLNVAGGTIIGTNVQLAEGRFSAQVQAQGVQVGRLAQVPPQIKGPLSGNFNVSGSLATLSPNTITGSGSGTLNVAGGTVTATNLQLDNGRFSAQVQADEVQVERLAQVPPQVKGPLSGNFNVSGSLATLSPNTITGSGSGTLNVAGGTLTATNLQLDNGRFSAQVQAQGVQVERLAQVPPQVKGPLSGNFNVEGSLASLSPTTIRGSGSGTVNVAGGTVTATNVQLDNGRFQAVVEPNGVQLAGFGQGLRGNLDGKLNVSGSLTALSPAAIQASGQVNFSEGLALIDRPLSASFSWNGQQLQIQQAIASGFSASGVVDVNLANTGLQAIRSFDLNVQAENLNLQQLAATLPNAVNVVGQADFNGRIAGTVSSPNVNGTLALRDFAVAGLTFESPLSGSVNTVPGQQLSLNLKGTNDQIQVALTPNYQPVSFLVQRGTAVASGSRQGDVLRVSAENFPIALIKQLAPAQTAIAPAANNVLRAIATQPLSGDISGNLDVNLKTFEVSLNQVAISGPIFEPSKGSQTQPGNNRYLISGRITQTATGPQFQNVQLNVEQGELPVVLAALRLLDAAQARTSFGNASDTLVSPVKLQDEPLQRQLQRLSEIKVLLEQQREQREASSLFPDVSLAKGSFTGTVKLDGSLASGFTTQFDIQGKNWELGSYSADQVAVSGEGSFQNGVITLLPLRIQSGDSLISYSGTIGGDAQSGQLQLQNIPLDQMQALLEKVPNLPPVLTGFDGLLNATATLSGSIKNPQARGEVSITDAALNKTPIQSAQGSFSYANARLNFGSTILLAGTEPLSVNGSIPYKLPIASVEPENNQLSLNIDVKNEGIAVLNLLSGGQATWLNGSGEVHVDVSGIYDQKASKLEQLIAKGEANIQNATIQARPLPEGEPLTNVNGRVLFDFDTVKVENMQGQFGGGAITAAGTIPISQPAPQENPLTVNIGELAINLKGLYRGHVRGNVVVTGAALTPKIGGQLNLFDGQVQLASGGTATAGGGATAASGATASGGATATSGATASGGATTGGSGSDNRTEFNSLKLTLDKGIQIAQAPILNFLASGTLTLNGPLDSIKPEGTIQLDRGQVNLFTTQFRLSRDYENTARFVANRGLDPILDVRLIASVTESTQRRLPTSAVSSEISDAPALGYGSVQTVRIQARALGPASQLADNLELTSSPSRSEAEIVALLGGSFVDTLGRGDSTLGLVNLAGSALLGNVQNIIGDALGLSEFRVFPTTINDDKRRTSTLGLAAEAGVDISRSFSVSVLKELTTDQPFQYNLRYRVNDKVLLRGGTDFSGDSRAMIEYENRF